MKLIECPRDAMQGIQQFIPTRQKAAYINQLLKVGFDTIDFGSFVSPRAIPQMSDTAEVLELLDKDSKSKLLAIVANKRGAEQACNFERINYIGYPFSLSETFQQRNTNSGIKESFDLVRDLQSLSVSKGKTLVVYFSMAFGNPYGDPWNADLVAEWTEKMELLGIKIIALSDTVGTSDVKSIEYLFSRLIPAFPAIEFGAHFHSRMEEAPQKAKTAYMSGCRRFDGAIKGFGGCPMAKDELVGNMPTEVMVKTFHEMGVELNLNLKELLKAEEEALSTFPNNSLV